MEINRIFNIFRLNCLNCHSMLETVGQATIEFIHHTVLLSLDLKGLFGDSFVNKVNFVCKENPLLTTDIIKPSAVAMNKFANNDVQHSTLFRSLCPSICNIFTQLRFDSSCFVVIAAES